MERVYSLDGMPESFWAAAPVPEFEDRQEKMGRSPSEWEFAKFLQETSDSCSIAQPTTTPEIVSRVHEAVEVKENLKPSSNHIPPSGKALSDPEFLKRQLDLACAAAANLNRTSGVKARESSPTETSRSQESDNSQMGSSQARMGSVYPLPKAQDMDINGSAGKPLLANVQNASSQIRPATSGSSRDPSDDDDLEGEPEITENMDPADVKRVKRMISNRESARRSRRRKQAHLGELETQVSQLRVENSSLLKRLTDINQKFSEASVNSRILKADVETMRAKVKMAEDTVKRVTGLNPMFPIPNMSNPSTNNVPLSIGTTNHGSASADHIQDDLNHYIQSLLDISLDSTQISETQNGTGVVAKMGGIGTTTMPPVPNIEHLQKHIHGGSGAHSGNAQWNGSSLWDQDNSGCRNHH